MEIWITPIALIVLILFFKITLFSNIPGKYENVSSLPKILETGINVFISNSQTITYPLKSIRLTNNDKISLEGNLNWKLSVLS